MRRVSLVLAAVVLVLTGLVPAGASAADCGEYVADDCPRAVLKVTSVKVIKVGQRPTVRVALKSSGAVEVTGTVTITYWHQKTGSRTRPQSIEYLGRSLAVVGPTLTVRGRYRVIVAFTPSEGSPFQATRAAITIAVRRR